MALRICILNNQLNNISCVQMFTALFLKNSVLNTQLKTGFPSDNFVPTHYIH